MKSHRGTDRSLCQMINEQKYLYGCLTKEISMYLGFESGLVSVHEQIDPHAWQTGRILINNGHIWVQKFWTNTFAVIWLGSSTFMCFSTSFHQLCPPTSNFIMYQTTNQAVRRALL